MGRFRHNPGRARLLLGWLLLNLLAAVALAASSQLHQLIHRDAGSSDHECAVTVMIAGGSDGSFMPQVFDAGAILPTAASVPPEVFAHKVAALFLSAHVFEHAPPFA